jgi:hypothetical protein
MVVLEDLAVVEVALVDQDILVVQAIHLPYLHRREIMVETHRHHLVLDIVAVVAVLEQLANLVVHQRAVMAVLEQQQH